MTSTACARSECLCGQGGQGRQGGQSSAARRPVVVRVKRTRSPPAVVRSESLYGAPRWACRAPSRTLGEDRSWERTRERTGAAALETHARGLPRPRGGAAGGGRAGCR
jgi:hypothetical protein